MLYEGESFLKDAISLDRKSHEAEAIPLYREAIKRGLSEEDLKHALICLASSFRNVGNISKSIKYIKIAKKKYPDDISVLMFYSLILFHSGDATTSIKQLASIVINLAGDNISMYRKPISRYYNMIKSQKTN